MEIIVVKQTDELLSKQDSDGVRRFLFQSIDGCNDQDKKAWRSFWRAIGKAGAGEFFIFSIKRQRSGKFHRLTMAVMQAVFKAQERFDNFSIFRSFLKLGAGFVDYIPDAETGELRAIPKSQSFADCSEEEVRQFFDDVLKFVRTQSAQSILWPHLYPQVAEQGIESILAQFESPIT